MIIFTNFLLELIKFKNSFIKFYYNILEKRRIPIIKDPFYYLWRINLFFDCKIDKKIHVSYIYDLTKCSTLYHPKNYEHLTLLHNDFVSKCTTCEETFGRKKTNIHSITDNTEKDYKYIIKLLPPKKIYLDYHTCDFFIDECKEINVIFMINFRRQLETYDWNKIKKLHIYDLLKLKN